MESFIIALAGLPEVLKSSPNSTSHFLFTNELGLLTTIVGVGAVIALSLFTNAAVQSATLRDAENIIFQHSENLMDRHVELHVGKLDDKTELFLVTGRITGIDRNLTFERDDGIAEDFEWRSIRRIAIGDYPPPDLAPDYIQ